MDIILETAVNLDVSTPNGSKNLQLLLSSMGIRSQVDFNGIAKKGKNWRVSIGLERPEFWGEDLELMREDLDKLILTIDKKPTPLVGQYKITQDGINNLSDGISEKAPFRSQL
jgi:hypothetical protein